MPPACVQEELPHPPRAAGRGSQQRFWKRWIIGHGPPYPPLLDVPGFVANYPGEAGKTGQGAVSRTSSSWWPLPTATTHSPMHMRVATPAHDALQACSGTERPPGPPSEHCMIEIPGDVKQASTWGVLRYSSPRWPSYFGAISSFCCLGWVGLRASFSNVCYSGDDAFSPQSHSIFLRIIAAVSAHNNSSMPRHDKSCATMRI